MSEAATETVETEETAGETSASGTEETATAEVEGADALGDKGKQALDRMKAEKKAEREARLKLEAEFKALKAQVEGKEAEHRAQQEAQKLKDDALSAANTRILKAEVRAAAKGQLADPADALLYIDLSSLEVGDDGEVDSAAIEAAVADLVKKKPYLAAQGGKRFQGGADGGTRNEARPAQLTRDDLSKMSPKQIEEARKKGQLNDLLGIK